MIPNMFPDLERSKAAETERKLESDSESSTYYLCDFKTAA